MQDFPTKVTGGTLTAAEFNDFINELENVIEDTGITLSGADEHQIGKSVSNYVAGGDFYTDAGTPDTYVLSVIGIKESPTAYFNGFRIRYVAGNSTTGGAATVNVAGLGVESIKRSDGTDPNAGDILTGIYTELFYNGANFIIVFPSSLTAELGRGYINGFLLTNDGGDLAHDINMAAGVARDQSNTFDINFASNITKQIDVNWALGDNQGGFPSGLALAIDTWYHYYAISKPDGTIDAGFDTSLTAANLLADATGFTKYRRVGSIKTDGSSNILRFIQYGDIFYWYDSPLDFNSTTLATSQDLTVSTPLDVRTMVRMNVVSDAASPPAYTYFRPPDILDEAVNDTAAPLSQGRAAGLVSMSTGVVNILTNTSSQISFRSDAAGIGLKVATLGWIDYRSVI